MSPEDRFWSKVQTTPTCWIWHGTIASNGYGKMGMGGRVQYAHRLAWYFTHGLLERELVVDHKCHNKRCVNPDHLQLVTESQNMQNRSGAAANSKSGVRNVHWEKSAGKWRVQMKVGDRRIQGGLYDDLDEAATVASAMRRTLMSNSIRDISA